MADGITGQTGQTGPPQDPGNYNDFIEVPDIMIRGDPAITPFTLPSPPNVWFRSSHRTIVNHHGLNRFNDICTKTYVQLNKQY
jgi:hypothetical protein